jgi:hypothetical protein
VESRGGAAAVQRIEHLLTRRRARLACAMRSDPASGPGTGGRWLHCTGFSTGGRHLGATPNKGLTNGEEWCRTLGRLAALKVVCRLRRRRPRRDPRQSTADGAVECIPLGFPSPFPPFGTRVYRTDTRVHKALAIAAAAAGADRLAGAVKAVSLAGRERAGPAGQAEPTASCPPRAPALNPADQTARVEPLGGHRDHRDRPDHRGHPVWS